MGTNTRWLTSRRLPVSSAFAGLLLLLGALLLATMMTRTADANAHDVECGDEITEDTTLSGDVGPCGDEHGLIVTADDVTLDLGGNSVIGDPAARSTDDKAGIQLRQVEGVTVENGTVEGFDAGVAIMGGGDNAVERITAQDNVNYRVVTGENASPDDLDFQAGILCLYGEGIVAFNSNGNSLEGNTIDGNGPMSGIGLVGDSNDNLVADNKVSDHDVRNLTPDGERTVCGGGHPDPDHNPMSTGRAVQDIGIRVEGPSADRNLVEDNQVSRGAIAGISIHAWNAEHVDTYPPSLDNVVRRNVVTETGRRTWQDDSHAHGIAIIQTGPPLVRPSHDATIEDNHSSRNYGHGIYVGGRETSGHDISGNVANHNRLTGIHLTGPSGDLGGAQDSTVTNNRANQNGEFDAFDGTGCDTNEWSGNTFHTVNDDCVGGARGRSGDTPSRDSDHHASEGGPLTRHMPEDDEG